MEPIHGMYHYEFEDAKNPPIGKKKKELDRKFAEEKMWTGFQEVTLDQLRDKCYSCE